MQVRCLPRTNKLRHCADWRKLVLQTFALIEQQCIELVMLVADVRLCASWQSELNILIQL